MLKTYKNISGIEQLDLSPGETGQRELPADQEARMVERGAIEVVSGSSESAATAEESPKAEESQEAQKTPEEIEAEQKAAEETAAAEKAEQERQARESQAGRGRGRG